MLGVIELGALKPFDADQLTLLEELLPTVALNLDILQRNLMKEDLLAKTQIQVGIWPNRSCCCEPARMNWNTTISFFWLSAVIWKRAKRRNMRSLMNKDGGVKKEAISCS
ncbi:MAG: hypothetical protein WC405_09545 [Syntrophales bacterium]